MNTIEINGQAYEVVGATKFEYKGKQRTELKLRKPNGRRFYFATVYENGTISEVA